MTSVALPHTFKAFAIEALKSPVKLVERTVTTLKADDVLVKVAYASLNPMDTKSQAMNIFHLNFPIVNGFDFSGTVAAVGSPASTEGIEVGAEVFGSTGIFGGCFAQYVVAKQSCLVPRRIVPAKDASTYGIAFGTAFESLELVGRVSERKGQWLYLAGAAGGVGHFGLQLAKIAGMKVIGSASKPQSLQLIKELGADHVIDYSKQDVVAEVMRITGGKGADLVYDPTYQPSSYSQSAACVASGGAWIKLGDGYPDHSAGQKIAEGRGAKVEITDLGRYFSNPHFIPKLHQVMDGMTRAVQWYAEGKLRPHVSRVFGFDAGQLQAALDDLMKGMTNVGKVTMQANA